MTLLLYTGLKSPEYEINQYIVRQYSSVVQLTHYAILLLLVVIDWKSRGKTKIMVKNSKNVSAKKVLRNSKRSIFLLSNDEETKYLDVTLTSEYTVLELGIETLLSNTTTVTSKPIPWPPGKSVSHIKILNHVLKSPQLLRCWSRYLILTLAA